MRDQFVQRHELNTNLKPDNKAVGRWNTHTGIGGLYSTTIGDAISGFSMDVGLVDDPYKDWTNAWSPATRRKVKTWFDSAFYTRKQENTTIIILHTRWHPDDLSGYLLKGQYDEQADMITTADEFYGDRWDTIQIMRDFTDRWWPQHTKHQSFSEIQIFGDSAGRSESIYTSDSGYKIMQRALTPLGVPVYKRVPPKAPGIIDSVLSTNDALSNIDGVVHWLIHSRCKKLIRDLREVMPDENGKPDKDADFTLTHASDAERYRVHRIRPLRQVAGKGQVNV